MKRFKSMGTMDLILILIGAALVAYIVADMVIFCVKGDEPSTLTGCVFAACSAEGGFMAIITRQKLKTNGGSGRGATEERKDGEEL